jgi:diguanylate cyclase (GGDEF)-like protein
MFRKGIKLQFAISLLVFITIFCTLLISWYSSAQALKASLTENYLESNEKYAAKLAASTNELMDHMQENINALARILGHQDFRQNDLDDWRSANSKYFNSLFITDPNGIIKVISPSVIQSIVHYKDMVQAGTKIESDTVKKALSDKKPFISEAYQSTSGQQILLVSAPIYSDSGKYKGLIGGTIYLESESTINHLLSESESVDGSYVYVVDPSGRIIYHPNKNRIGDVETKNPVVQRVAKGESGASETVNTEGNEFFAGYAYEDMTGWGIVSQTPTSIIHKPLQDLFKKVMIQSLPLVLLILVFAGILSTNLSRPLNTLAKFSENALNEQRAAVPFMNLKIKSSIYEVRQLYHHINNYLKLLNNQIHLDGLTGLANRKSFDLSIRELFEQRSPFTVIMLDIDRFKNVNDTYGHLTGDDVLKFLAAKIKLYTRENDLSFRYGGEEFGILSKDLNLEDAFKIAEQLRTEVSDTPSPTGQPITISLGISTYQLEDKHPEDIIKRADSALYQSKLDGRNRTTIFGKQRNLYIVK